MTPVRAIEWIRSGQTSEARRERALTYLAESTQWVEQTDGTLRWGWFAGPGPQELALAALAHNDDEPG